MSEIGESVGSAFTRHEGTSVGGNKTTFRCGPKHKCSSPVHRQKEMCAACLHGRNVESPEGAVQIVRRNAAHEVYKIGTVDKSVCFVSYTSISCFVDTKQYSQRTHQNCAKSVFYTQLSQIRSPTECPSSLYLCFDGTRNTIQTRELQTR